MNLKDILLAKALFGGGGGGSGDVTASGNNRFTGKNIFTNEFTLFGKFKDKDSNEGANGQVLTSVDSKLKWTNPKDIPDLLYRPDTAPTSDVLVGFTSENNQQEIELGDGLELTDGKLKVTHAIQSITVSDGRIDMVVT